MTKRAQVGNQADKQQVAAFRKAARELECDESEEKFQEALRGLARPKPKSAKGETRRRQRR
jgi:hypothetical protein